MAFLATASGLMMDRVRSTGMRGNSDEILDSGVQMAQTRVLARV
jgi:hypothetical protein